jgi:putative addiction module component (TIGR02574 family)
MKTIDLLKEAISLPVEERTFLADSLLKSLNQPEPEIDKLWSEIARIRLAELKSGKVRAVPGEEVFEKIRKRFEK